MPNITALLHVFLPLYVFAVKQQPDLYESAKFAFQKRGKTSAVVSTDSISAPFSTASPLAAGDHSGSSTSTGPLQQSLSKEAALQPDAFLQEGSAQSESTQRRLHQASPSSSAAAGSSFILVFISLNPFLTCLLCVILYDKIEGAASHFLIVSCCIINRLMNIRRRAN